MHSGYHFHPLALWRVTVGMVAHDSWCDFACLSKIGVVCFCHCFLLLRAWHRGWPLFQTPQTRTASLASAKGIKETKHTLPAFSYWILTFKGICVRSLDDHGDDKTETSVMIHDKEYSLCKK